MNKFRYGFKVFKEELATKMLNGILLIDKPKGLTSYKVVEKIRMRFRIKKAGHLGTLDPMATGLLPVCLNEATKMVQFLINKDKAYEGTMLLGITTDTGDLEGKVTSESKDWRGTEEEIKGVFESFKGNYSQTPPMYSAIKHNGRRLYELAREGKEIERREREITIYSLEVCSFSYPILTFKVTSSKGTYIRSLVSEIGKELGCGATLKELRRTKVGSFSIEDAKTLSEILKKTALLENDLLDIKIALKEMSHITIKNSFLHNALQGTPIYKGVIEKRDFRLKKGEFVKVFSPDGKIISIAYSIRKEEEFKILGEGGIVFNHVRVFSSPL